MKIVYGAILISTLGLAACQSTPNPTQPQLQTQKIYHAPAQIFDFDLGNSALRGKLQLKQSCDVIGTSLDIRDQLSQQVRIDTFNLRNNPQLNLTAQSSLKQIAEQLLSLYQQKYKANLLSAPQYYKTTQNEVVIGRLQIGQQPIDIAIQTAYDYAYVITLNSPLQQSKPQNTQQQLQILLKSLSIPGSKITSSKATGSTSDLPIAFDLSNHDANARRNWQKTYCL